MAIPSTRSRRHPGVTQQATAPRRPKVGLALAGGGPLGAIYEIGTLVALSEALEGLDFNELNAYVGVSAGALIAAGLANGMTPAAMCRMFIDSDSAEVPFVPSMLLKPAFGEYAQRLRRLPGLLWSSARDYLDDPLHKDLLACFERMGRVLPAGLFDNRGIAEMMERVFHHAGRSNDFRDLKHRLFLVATDLDTGAAVAFGSPGYDHVPISTAVQASSALPGLYPPVPIDGRWYVDGALKKTMHASVALKAGAELVICVNPLVPYDAQRAAELGHHHERQLVNGGLPVVLAQTFRAIIHSRMQVGIANYEHEFKGADVILFEPRPDDDDMFFTNMFSYAGRQWLSEHVYHRTREELLRRHDELAPKLARHGVHIRREVLTDPDRTLKRHLAQLKRRRARALGLHALQLSDTLDELNRAVNRLQARQRGKLANAGPSLRPAKSQADPVV
jgi:predicted acylesterase/phospholipase RssA